MRNFLRKLFVKYSTVDLLKEFAKYEELKSDYDELAKKYNERIEDLEYEQDRYEELEGKFKDRAYVMRVLLDRDLGWFNYEKIEAPADLKAYGLAARAALENIVIRNEINFLINNWAKEGLFGEKTTVHNIDDLRLMALSLDTFVKRLESIPQPDLAPPPVKDPYAPV